MGKLQQLCQLSVDITHLVVGGNLCGPGPDQASQILVQHRCPLCQCSSSTGWFGVNSVRLGDMESQGGSEHLHLHQRFHHHGPCDGFVDKADIPLEFCSYQTEYHFSH